MQLAVSVLAHALLLWGVAICNYGAQPMARSLWVQLLAFCFQGALQFQHSRSVSAFESIHCFCLWHLGQPRNNFPMNPIAPEFQPAAAAPFQPPYAKGFGKGAAEGKGFGKDTAAAFGADPAKGLGKGAFKGQGKDAPAAPKEEPFTKGAGKSVEAGSALGKLSLSSRRVQHAAARISAP